MVQRYPAQYFDGQSAANHAVAVVLAPHGLALEMPGGTQLWWPMPELRVTELPDTVRFERGMESLVVEGAAFRTAWRRVRGRDGLELKIAIGLGALGVAAMVLLLSFLAYGFSWMTGAMASLLPLLTEEAIGRAALESLAPKPKRCVDPAVERIAEGLRATVPDSRYTFRVYIAEESMVNAFAAPGGYIVLFRGLLDKTRRPEEAAEIGRASCRERV